ncbi:tRNA uridine-5-carboxymethylaminomethyl(34) synthesis GTPase MnmE [Porphyromonadaceae bacterium]
MINDNQTICAVSTAPGVGGVAMIRVSGQQAVSISNSLFRPSRASKQLIDRTANSLSYGVWHDSSQTDIDDVVVGLFRAPHSFTGEDTVEITCHGSLFIQQSILRSLIESGCRLATAGEFTQRAFLNGKMDLSQAEAVADLIASSSAASHRLALNQMRGGFSDELKHLRMQLLDFVSLIELELDFSEEDVEFADRSRLTSLADQIESVISRLADSFQVGNAIKQGVPVAIVGETNVGKSTLLNRLLNEEKAIVSDIHGTTRDVIEDVIHLGGIAFRFIDTAGIRQTTDEIESIGIKRTFEKIEQASIVLWVVDTTQPIEQIRDMWQLLASSLERKRYIVVLNKIDLVNDTRRQQWEDSIHSAIRFTTVLHSQLTILSLSAKNDDDIAHLESQLIAAAQLPEVGDHDVIVTNLRHYEALTQALSSIQRVKEGLATHLSGDFVSQDIRECLFHLATITGGQITTDEILGSIFSRFCIGK